MQCFRCPSPAVLFQRYSGRFLCAVHLCADIESRAKRVIRQNRWLVSGDRIGIVSGLAHSNALMIFLERLVAGRSDITLTWLGSPPGFSEKTPGWFHSLSQAAIEAGCTRLSLPWCADDLAEEILSSLLRGETATLLTTVIQGMDIPLMQPLQEIPAEELRIYAQYHDRAGYDRESPVENSNTGSFNADIKNFLSDFSERHPSAPHALRRYQDHLRDLSGE